MVVLPLFALFPVHQADKATNTPKTATPNRSTPTSGGPGGRPLATAAWAGKAALACDARAQVGSWEFDEIWVSFFGGTLFGLGLKGNQKETNRFLGFPILRHAHI